MTGCKLLIAIDSDLAENALKRNVPLPASIAYVLEHICIPAFL